MRVSAIADWTTCEAMALSDPRQEARVHVAGMGWDYGPRTPERHRTRGHG